MESSSEHLYSNSAERDMQKMRMAKDCFHMGTNDWWIRLLEMLFLLLHRHSSACETSSLDGVHRARSSTLSDAHLPCILISTSHNLYIQ